MWLLALPVLVLSARSFRVSSRIDQDRDQIIAEDVAGATRGSLECGEIEEKYVLRGRHIGDYRFERCLAAGDNGEAWLANLDERTAVVKLLKTHARPEASEELKHECDFAREASNRDASHFVWCLETGELKFSVADGEVNMPFAAFEMAPGKELERVLHDSPSQAIQELPKLSDIVHCILELYNVMDVLSRPISNKTLYHMDLSPSNIFISAGKKLTVIDYGLSLLCNDTGCSESDHMRGRQESIKFLVIDFLSMLMHRPPNVTKKVFYTSTIFGILGLAMSDADKAVSKIESMLRIPYDTDVNGHRDLFRAAARAGVKSLVDSLIHTQGESVKWPPVDFISSLTDDGRFA